LFIFRPMAREVIGSRRSQQKLLSHLQEIVELRTLKLESANKKLQQLAIHDPLTGLRNRLKLESDIETLIKGQHKHRIPFAVGMIDLDWFKNVNDTLGHLAGDWVLQELAGILNSITRESDKVYRSGGEEFVIVLNRIDIAEARNKIESLRQKVEQHLFCYEQNEIRITISVGLFHSTMTSLESVHDILKITDDALYRSKQLGRNRITLADYDAERLEAKQGTIELVFNETDLSAIAEIRGDISAFLALDAASESHEGLSLKDLFYAPDLDYFERLKAMAQAREDTFFTARLRSADGHISIYRIDLLCEDARYVVMLQKASELATSIGNELLIANFNAMLENSNDYIYFKDRNHVFTAASLTLVSLTNVDNRENLVGKTDYEVFPVEFADKYYDLEKKVFAGEVDVAQEFQPTLSKDGDEGWVDNRKYPIKDRSGKVIGLFGIARKISVDEYKTLIDRLSQESG
jgi:two-component system cell cycle response regulator